MEWLQTVPILRIFDVVKAVEFYEGYLGFSVDWQHRFGANTPVYMQVSRGGLVLHLSEHHGDGTPGTILRACIRGLDGFHAELGAKGYRYMNPGIERQPWGERCMTVIDPFGNQLHFVEALPQPDPVTTPTHQGGPLMSRLVHFEIHATNPDVLIPFYSQLFGWTFQKWESAAMEYWMISTGPKEKPGIDGGLIKRMGPAPVHGQAVNAFPCTMDVVSAEGAIAAAVELGGEVALPVMAVPGVGWLGYAKDPDGNIFGVMQMDPSAA